MNPSRPPQQPQQPQPSVEPGELSVTRAREAIARQVRPVTDVEPVSLHQALGRVLADDLQSPVDVPPADNAAMDGYAVRAIDLADPHVVLTVAGSALAGRPFTGSCGPGQAIRIMTGASMPAGADTVVAQESVERDGDQVVIPAGQRAGQHCRRRGESLAAGAIALPAGRTLGAAELGLIASLGLAGVEVRRRLRVAVLSTGDELVAPGEPLAAGQIHDCNRVALLAALQRLGFDGVDGGIVPDRPDALRAALDRLSPDVDAILSSGGVSVGDADHTRAVMASLGDILFTAVAMRPGRPMAFGRIGHCLYVGLPGNPVAMLVAFHFIVRDALLRLAGASPTPVPVLKVRSRSMLRKRAGRTEFQRGRLAHADDGAIEVIADPQQGSAILRSMTDADVIIRLDESAGDVAAGSLVDVLPLHGLY